MALARGVVALMRADGNLQWDGDWPSALTATLVLTRFASPHTPRRHTLRGSSISVSADGRSLFAKDENKWGEEVFPPQRGFIDAARYERRH